MSMTQTEYWTMIWRKAWIAAWARARSWSVLTTIVIGIAGLYVIVPNELRIRLAWQLPLGLTLMFLLYFIPRSIYESRGDTGDLVGKWFHTINAEGKIQFQGRVLENRGSRHFVQLYSYIDGEPTTQRLLTEDEQRTARFYDSNQAMLDEYDRLHPPGARMGFP